MPRRKFPRQERDLNFSQISSYPSLIITKNSQDLRLEKLSDGEKMLLMLVTDLARRLAIANPSSNDALKPSIAEFATCCHFYYMKPVRGIETCN
ncbi:hypothetical protein [Scytonema sp. NUACC26]|uniref:hypothetical protein n=1 Tax=Scytonema sp. NUACC26 TaxID=3140176 RepID=UPI0038B2A5F2